MRVGAVVSDVELIPKRLLTQATFSLNLVRRSRVKPTSAIVSGVDLIEDPESQDMREEALALVISSSRKLGALLQFCRVAYGASASADTFGSGGKQVADATAWRMPDKRVRLFAFVNDAPRPGLRIATSTNSAGTSSSVTGP